jgi:hypothetical protein
VLKQNGVGVSRDGRLASAKEGASAVPIICPIKTAPSFGKLQGHVGAKKNCCLLSLFCFYCFVCSACFVCSVCYFVFMFVLFALFALFALLVLFALFVLFVLFAFVCFLCFVCKFVRRLKIKRRPATTDQSICHPWPCATLGTSTASKPRSCIMGNFSTF